MKKLAPRTSLPNLGHLYFIHLSSITNIIENWSLSWVGMKIMSTLNGMGIGKKKGSNEI